LIKLNDHYFIAWLNIVKKIDFVVINNSVNVFMSSEEYSEYLREYKLTLKPLLKEIRSTVKALNNLTSQPAKG
jgi:hypothetical protein